MTGVQGDALRVPSPAAPLLQVADLSVVFRSGRRAAPVQAVDAVSLTVGVGETVGVVGESGSGKTTLGRAILGLVEATAGTVRFDGRDITHAGRPERRRLSQKMQVIFQDPFGSLSPTRTVEQTLTEPLTAQRRLSPSASRAAVVAMIDRVGLSADALPRYPSEFSGGQRQRIAIARALMVSPRLVICDEPTSALDLSMQAQVLNLLRDLQKESALGYVFIAHNLSVVRHMSHRIVVLNRGRIMEEGPADRVYRSPAHPYTRALVDAAPVPDPRVQETRRGLRLAAENLGTAHVGDEGCPFADRCRYSVAACRTTRPELRSTPTGTRAACLRLDELPEYQALTPETRQLPTTPMQDVR